MATTVTLYANKSAEIDISSSSYNDHQSTTALGTYDKRMLVSFEQLSDVYKFRKIQYFEIFAYVQAWTNDSLYTGKCQIDRLLETFDENTVTYGTEPAYEACTTIRNIGKDSVQKYYSELLSNSAGYMLKDIIENGCRFTSSYATVQTSRGANVPYIVIAFQDENVGLDISNGSPASGAYISKGQANLFTWDTTVDTTWACVGDVQPKSTIFRWKDEAGTVHELSAGSANSITVPANTFTGSELQWQVEVTANSGIVTTSEWITLSTSEPESTAIAKSPRNTVVDGAGTATFTWEHVISTGSAQTAFDLQISQNKETWNTLTSDSSPDTSVEVPGSELPGGTLYWRVRTYNTDGVAGAWSEAVHIVVVAAPDTPSITVTSTEPRFAIRWQQSGQQAYELQLDGVTISKQFGAVSSYQYDGYLSPGTYTVRVRIQNQYGLWSEWGAAALPITDTEGTAITLNAEGSNSVTLSWTGASEYSGYIIYRDGVKLAETTETSFVDHFALGTVQYQVRGVYADSGYYTLSNLVIATVSVSSMLIADVNSPVWLDLSRSTSFLRSCGLQSSRSVTYVHYVGVSLPSAEIGETLDQTYTLECAWKTNKTADIAAFEALLGNVVCLKTPYGRRIIGVLNPVDCQENKFTTSFNCTITLIDWDDTLLPVGSGGSGGASGGENNTLATLVIDKTLTMENAAAEAKATGDRLDTLEDTFGDFMDEATALVGGV